MKEVKRNRDPYNLKPNFLDKAITWVSPKAGLDRMHARAKMALTGGYYSGDRSRRANKSWGLSSGSADAEILPHLDALRSDSQDLMRKAPLARGAINTVVTSVVGTGLKPQSRPDSSFLKKYVGLTDDQIEEFSEAAEREFKRWTKKRNCDAADSLSFYGMQELVLRSALVSGDVICIRRNKQKRPQDINFCLQLIEADRMDNPKRAPDNEKLAGGVERDAYGAAKYYHILKSHPGDRFVTSDRFVTEKFPAYLSNGEWNVLHLVAQKERPEQTRGVPYLAPVIESLKQLANYSEAEIAAAVVSSMFTVFVKTETGDGLPGSSDGSHDDDEIKLGSGAVIDLANNEDVSFADPSRPNQAFDPFVQAILRQIGVALELPFEILIKHFTASYSAAQAALLEAWKFYKKRRQWLADGLCTPCWEAAISEAVATGLIKAPGFFSSTRIRDAYLGVHWNGPPRGSIDPVKEANAAKIHEEQGWTTAQQNAAELNGSDWDSNMRRRAIEERTRKESGALSGQQSETIQPQPDQPEVDPEDRPENA